MPIRRHLRLYLFTLFSLGLALPSGRALLNLDGSRNQVFVFGNVSFGYDTNIFADSSGRGDYTLSATAGVELKRRAGIIAVNAALQVNYQRFHDYTSENSYNPSIYVEFIKTTGRTTGSLTINAYRESRSDSAVNVRTSSWNLPIGLNLKYPVNDKYYVTSTTAYLQRLYEDNTALADLTDFSEALDVFYVYTSKLDLLGGYRIRFSQTSAGTDTTDHWFNVGATGGLFAKLSGTVRVGYQIRQVQGSAPESFDNFNMLASVNWPVTRKFGLAGQVSRDFNTIATSESVDAISAGLRANYAYNRKLDFVTGVTVGRNTFLGLSQPDRVDTYLSWDVGAHYRFNEHLIAGATYTYYRNWSTYAYSDFDRQTFSVDISSHY